jgi:hypothetical protein
MQHQSEHINELAVALSKAQGEIDGAKKDSVNPFFKASYADLASVIAAAKAPLAKYGLAYTQLTNFDENGSYLITTLMHSSGQWIAGKYPLGFSDNKIQTQGSTITYVKRYTLQAMLGIASEDDDGNSAQQNHRQAPAPVAPKAVEQVDTLAELRAQVSKLVVKNKIPATEMRKFIATNFGEGSMLASLGENELQQTLAFVEKNHDK